MQKTLRRIELEKQLSGKADAINRRFDALQNEVGGISVQRIVKNQPWLAVGGAVAGGLLVGLLFGGSSKRRSSTEALQRSLVEGYIDAVGDDVSRLVGKGRAAREAVHDALRDRVPVLIYAPEGELERRGLLGQVFDLAFKTAVGFAVKAAIDYATRQVDLEELVEEIADAAGAHDQVQSQPADESAAAAG